MGYSPVRSTIISLKLVDYLSFQTIKTCSILYKVPYHFSCWRKPNSNPYFVGICQFHLQLKVYLVVMSMPGDQIFTPTMTCWETSFLVATVTIKRYKTRRRWCLQIRPIMCTFSEIIWVTLSNVQAFLGFLDAIFCGLTRSP